MNGRGQYDYLIKLLIIGNSGVGKTCILLQFSEGNFTTSHLTTIGIDFKIKTVDVDGKQIKLQIWDTAGQERFRTITQTYYKNAMGIILAYDVTDENSYNDICKWMQQIDTHASENVAKILIGNKSDRPDRKISMEQGQKLADEYNIKFMETSAKNNSNINEAFYYIAKQIKDTKLAEDPARDSVRLEPQKPKGGESSGGCFGSK